MGARTAFDRFLAEKLRDAGFRMEYRSARAQIDATDSLIRALEGARAARGMTKAELARRMNVKPEIVRRLLTDVRGNPTLRTVVEVAAALGCHVELVPDAGRRIERSREAARRARG